MDTETAAKLRKERNTPCSCCGQLPSVKALAAKYGVSITHVSMIANGRRHAR